jgi:hypothetical protein
MFKLEGLIAHLKSKVDHSNTSRYTPDKTGVYLDIRVAEAILAELQRVPKPQ